MAGRLYIDAAAGPLGVHVVARLPATRILKDTKVILITQNVPAWGSKCSHLECQRLGLFLASFVSIWDTKREFLDDQLRVCLYGRPRAPN